MARRRGQRQLGRVHDPDRPGRCATWARHVAETLIGAADFLLDEAHHGAGARLMTVGLHPRWSGQAARATAVRDFLQHATTTPGIALVHREQVVDWWREHVG